MSSQQPLLYLNHLLFDSQFNNTSFNPVMKLFNKLPVQRMKDMLEMIFETPATFFLSFFMLMLSIVHFVFIVFVIRELILVLQGLRTDGKNKMEAIKKIGGLEQNHKGLQQQLQRVDQQLTQLEQQLREHYQKQEEKERSDSTRFDSLQSRVYILDKFREGNYRWNKLQREQEALNRTPSEATDKAISRVTKLEIKYTTAIRDLEKRLRKMDRIVADNFNVVTKYTEKIASYCTEGEEESKKMADGLNALQDQVKQELRGHQKQIKNLEHKLARLQYVNWSYTYPSTKSHATPESKSMDTKRKQADIAKEVPFMKSTSTGE